MATSFEEYVTARGAGLVRFAYALVDDRHRAEDLVQEVLARSYLRWSAITRADEPDSYVRQAIVNASRSWWRRRSNRERPIDAGSARLAEPVAPGAPDVELAERDAMWRNIRRLPARQREVLVLRYYEDLDDQTIAAILGCTPVTVRSHAMRALNTLRDRIGTPTAATRRPS